MNKKIGIKTIILIAVLTTLSIYGFILFLNDSQDYDSDLPNNRVVFVETSGIRYGSYMYGKNKLCIKNSLSENNEKRCFFNFNADELLGAVFINDQIIFSRADSKLNTRDNEIVVYSYNYENKKMAKLYTINTGDRGFSGLGNVGRLIKLSDEKIALLYLSDCVGMERSCKDLKASIIDLKNTKNTKVITLLEGKRNENSTYSYEKYISKTGEEYMDTFFVGAHLLDLEYPLIVDNDSIEFIGEIKKDENEKEKSRIGGIVTCDLTKDFSCQLKSDSQSFQSPSIPIFNGVFLNHKNLITTKRKRFIDISGYDLMILDFSFYKNTIYSASIEINNKKLRLKNKKNLADFKFSEYDFMGTDLDRFSDLGSSLIVSRNKKYLIYQEVKKKAKLRSKIYILNLETDEKNIVFESDKYLYPLDIEIIEKK